MRSPPRWRGRLSGAVCFDLIKPVSSSKLAGLLYVDQEIHWSLPQLRIGLECAHVIESFGPGYLELPSLDAANWKAA